MAKSSPAALSAADQQFLQRVQLMLGEGQGPRALAMVQQFVRQRPRSPDGFQTLAMCRSTLGDVDGAQQAFAKALKLAPGHPLILTNQGHMQLRFGRAEAALRSFQQASRRAPRMAPAWLGLAQAARSIGDLAQAASAIDEYLKLEPQSAMGWSEQGQILQAQERYEQARDSLERAVELAPDRDRYHFSLGVCHRLMGRPELAIECYRRARELGIDQPDLDNAEIGALLDSGDVAGSLAMADRLVDRHPDYIPGLETLINLVWEYGGPDQPEPDQLFDRSKRLSATPRAVEVAFARFLLKAKRGAEAAELLERLRRDQDEPGLTIMQANALEIDGQTEAAGRLYRAMHSELGDREPSFLNAYTRHLLRSGEWQQARKRAEAAVRIAPEDQEAWAYLGTAWRLLGDAREDWLCDYERSIVFLEVETPSDYPDSDAHIEALQAVLNRLHQAHREPIQQSLRKGSQTPGRLFGRPIREIEQTQAALTRTIESWLARWPRRDDHPFYQRNTGRIRYTGSWSVKLRSTGNHVNHIHSQGWISSAYYVALPPSVAAEGSGEDSLIHPGSIQFGQPPVELELGLPPRRTIKPRVGHLALFPSYMWHGTVPFEDEQPRMTMAFDMRPAFD
jgi:tetratricopeptide (TPR) repeat protein